MSFHADGVLVNLSSVWRPVGQVGLTRLVRGATRGLVVVALCRAVRQAWLGRGRLDAVWHRLGVPTAQQGPSLLRSASAQPRDICSRRR